MATSLVGWSRLAIECEKHLVLNRLSHESMNRPISIGERLWPFLGAKCVLTPLMSTTWWFGYVEPLRAEKANVRKMGRNNEFLFNTAGRTWPGLLM